PGEPERVLREASAALDGLDLVVQSAGVVAFGPVAELTDETLVKLVEINLLAPIRLARAALDVLDRGGTIVQVSAIVADAPTAGMAAYSASKAGLTAFDRALAREARRAGVRVIDVRPPHLDTGLEGRPIAGEPPTLPPGRDVREAAGLIVDALTDERAREVLWD
ncbi:MAG: SDR family NAD(P)-dependent oxidoreductase, partial [Ilumatobacteraceae bacterium]